MTEIQWLGMAVIYSSSSLRQYNAKITALPENPWHNPKYTELPTVSLEFRDQRGKLVRMTRVLPWVDGEPAVGRWRQADATAAKECSPPPFCAGKASEELTCPACNCTDCVHVREKDSYFDGDACEAYCAECHARLEVQVSVQVTFLDPEIM